MTRHPQLAVVKEAVLFVAVLLVLPTRVRPCFTSRTDLEHAAPTGSEEYEDLLKYTREHANSLRVRGIDLQKEVDLFNKNMDDVKRQRSRISFLHGRPRVSDQDMEAFREHANTVRKNLQDRMKQLEGGTDVLGFQVSRLAGFALSKDEDMQRHQRAAPALRATIQWLRGVSHSNLKRVPTVKKS